MSLENYIFTLKGRKKASKKAVGKVSQPAAASTFISHTLICFGCEILYKECHIRK